MANETMLPIIGSLTADPELRFTQAGVAVASFTIASNPRVLDRASGKWIDGDPLFMRCSIWRDYAENVNASLHKGDRVMAYGRLVQRQYKDREGNDRTSIELEVEDIGPVLRWATARVDRVAPREARTQAREQDWTPPAAQQPTTEWNTAPVSSGYVDDEVPF